MTYPRMPGLTAERSLYRSVTHYRTPAGPIHPFGRRQRPSRSLPPGMANSSPNAASRVRIPQSNGPQPNSVPPDWIIDQLSPTLRVCNGELVNVLVNRENCGACGNSCAGDGSVSNPDDDLCFCFNGGCACRAHCPEIDSNGNWWTSCGSDCDSPQSCRTWRCRDLTSDSSNCGSCGNACDLGNTCCSGMCKDLQADVNNCGSCGNMCVVPNGTAACKNGVCEIASCDPGYTNCGGKYGQCVDLNTDPNNCTACGKACITNQICDGGCTCKNGETVCNNECVDVGSDPKNCGKCGFDVSPATCCSGSPCPAPKVCCGGACVDLSSDPQNCGSCGTKAPTSLCSGTQTKCVNGSPQQDLVPVTCYREDGSTRCLVGSHTYSAFNAADALGCVNHDYPNTINICGAAPQNQNVAQYAVVDTMTCASGWQCTQTLTYLSQSASDALTCASSQYNQEAYMMVGGTCVPGQCLMMKGGGSPAT